MVVFLIVHNKDNNFWLNVKRNIDLTLITLGERKVKSSLCIGLVIL